MKLLRETIRRLILQELLKRRPPREKKKPSEACAKLNNVIQKAVDSMTNMDLELTHYINRSGLRVIIKYSGENKKIAILKATNADWVRGGDCHGGWMVEWAKVEEDLRDTGLGALLYDVALEMVGSDGLMADRTTVSSDAIRNWNYFYSSNDYIKKPLDDRYGSYTPGDTSDDCDAGSYLAHKPSTWSDPPTREEFQSHSLNQVIVKIDQTQPTITCLREKGRTSD